MSEEYLFCFKTVYMFATHIQQWLKPFWCWNQDIPGEIDQYIDGLVEDCSISH